MEWLELFYIADGNASWKTIWQLNCFSYKLKHTLIIYDPAVPILGIYPRETKKLCSHKDLCFNFYGSFIHNSSKLSNVHQLVNGCQIVVYPYNRILLNNTKEWTTEVYNNMNESQKHSAEWRKSETKDYILHDFIDMKF